MTELVVERSEFITVLALNRPEKRNALSATLVKSLIEEIEGAATRDTRLLVLRGNGECFSAGFDLSELERQSDGDLLLRFLRIEQLLQALYYAPFDAMAVAHGHNIGAGADLFCACARRIAAEGTTFRMPGYAFGLVLGTRRLVERIGSSQAMAVLRGGLTLDSAKALKMGLITELCAQSNWDDRIADALRVSSGISSDSNLRLNRAVLPDTRDGDVADLVRSAAFPSLKERITVYRDNNRRRQG